MVGLKKGHFYQYITIIIIALFICNSGLLQELLSNSPLEVNGLEGNFTTIEYHQKCSRLSIFDENYGQPRDIFVEEREGRILAYIAEFYGGIAIFDVTDPANPLFLSQIGYFSTYVIYVFENIAYVGEFDTIIIIDVSIPEQPVEIGFYRNDYNVIEGMVGKGDLLFVVTYYGLVVLDITNPQEPQDLEMSLSLWGLFHCILLSDDYIFIAGDKQLIIFDISNPSNIYQRYNTNLTEGTLSRMYVHENVLMFFGGQQYSSKPSPIILLNITDIDNPVEIGRYYEEGVTILNGVVKGETLYVVTTVNGIRLFNYTEPDNLQLMANYSLTGWYRNVFFSPERMYLVSRSYGIEILTYGKAIEEVASLGHLWQGGETLELAVNGTKAYLVNGWNGLTIIDITNLREPKKISNIKSFTKYYDSVAVSGKYAYLFNVNTKSLDIYDVSEPANPIVVFENSTQEYSYSYDESRIIVKENLAYVVLIDYSKSSLGAILQIFNVTNPENPQKIGETVFRGYIWDICLDQGIFYLTGIGGLQIFSISTSGTLVSLANFTVAKINNFFEVVVSGNYAFLADASYGLRIVNIEEPTNPVEVGKYETIVYEEEGGAYKIAVNGTRAYLVSDTRGLLMLDISNTVKPKLVGQYYYVVNEDSYQHGYYGANIMGVHVEGKTIFLAMGWEGMIILKKTYSEFTVAARNALIISALVVGDIIAIVVLKIQLTKRKR